MTPSSCRCLHDHRTPTVPVHEMVHCTCSGLSLAAASMSCSAPFIPGVSPRDQRRPDIRRDSGEPPRGPTPAGPVPSPRSDAPEGGLPAQREPPSPNDRGQSVATRRAVARKPRASACGPTKIRPGLSRVAGTAGFPSVQTRESREVGNPLQAARTRLTYNLVSGRFS